VVFIGLHVVIIVNMNQRWLCNPSSRDSMLRVHTHTDIYECLQDLISSLNPVNINLIIFHVGVSHKKINSM